MSTRDIYLAAASQALDLLADPRVASQWDQASALPQMAVGALAGHLGRSVLQVDWYLESEPPPKDARCLSAIGYYAGLVGVDDRGSELNVGVRQRAEESAASGHHALLAQVSQGLARLRERLPGEPADRRLEVFRGRVLLLDEYLKTRLIEITVHVDDLAVSLGLATPEMPEPALETAIGVLVGVARARQGTLAVLRALTRRERDPGSALRAL